MNRYRDAGQSAQQLEGLKCSHDPASGEQFPEETHMSGTREIARASESVWQSRDFEKARSYLVNDIVCDSPFGRAATAEAMVGRFGRFSQVVSRPARELAGFGNDEERPPQIVLVERHT